MIHKVLQVQKKIGLNDAEFARSIGYKPQNFNQWKSGESPVPAKAVLKILEIYPEIDANFFMSDEYEMLKSSNNTSIITNGKNNTYQVLEGKGHILKENKGENQKLLEAKDREIEALKKVIETQEKLIERLTK